jgi:pimeloyl-ACP methyl ester carboxylesterase
MHIDLDGAGGSRRVVQAAGACECRDSWGHFQGGTPGCAEVPPCAHGLQTPGHPTVDVGPHPRFVASSAKGRAVTTTPSSRRKSPGRTPRRPRCCQPKHRSAITQHKIILHGQQVTYLEAGADSGGPVVVLLHGLASSSQTWATVAPLLGAHAHVIAPDLLGHGESAKPRSGDYSLGAYAAGLRDLLIALGVPRATIVGHSFGGGVAMQFAYQFPELTERLVLVASGGLGPDVSPALRAATLPGTALALRVAATLTPKWLTRLGQRVAQTLPGTSGPEIDGLADAFRSFTDRGARSAFTRTVRGALNLSGQRLDGTERLYLLTDTPVLLVAGNRDSVIPVAHSRAAHHVLPVSRLEIFDGTGHFPHVEQPQRFADLLNNFLATSAPVEVDAQSMRRQLLDHRH